MALKDRNKYLRKTKTSLNYTFWDQIKFCYYQRLSTRSLRFKRQRSLFLSSDFHNNIIYDNWKCYFRRAICNASSKQWCRICLFFIILTFFDIPRGNRPQNCLLLSFFWCSYSFWIKQRKMKENIEYHVVYKWKNSYQCCTEKSTLLLTQVYGTLYSIINNTCLHHNLCHETVPFLLSFGWPVLQCIQNIAFEKLLIRHSHLYWVTRWAMLTIPE